MVKNIILLLSILLISINTFSQETNSWKLTPSDSISQKKQNRLDRREARQIKNQRPYDALAPTKASFYSAILPGLGQAYTRKYWKIPIVAGALGTGIGFALWNQRKYDEFRDIYKNRLLGITNDRYIDTTNEQILSHSEDLEKDRDLSILISVGIYILNIIDANVTAHLQQYNINNKLSLNPNFKMNDYYEPNYGLSLSYSFK